MRIENKFYTVTKPGTRISLGMVSEELMNMLSSINSELEFVEVVGIGQPTYNLPGVRVNCYSFQEEDELFQKRKDFLMIKSFSTSEDINVEQVEELLNNSIV